MLTKGALISDRRNPLAGVNLNLFPVLDAMLRHRSVSRAAEELGVTPSAVSHALRELRALLDDPLFVRSGVGMMPTRRATDVEIALRGSLGALSEVVQRRAEFDAAASRRSFSVATSDEFLMQTAPRIFERMQREAPGMGLNLRPRSTQSMEQLEMGELDLLLRLTGKVPSWATREPLDWGRVVCLVRGDHPSVGDTITREQYRRLPHVRVSPQGFGASETEKQLAALGIERTVLVYTYSFATAAHFVARSDAVVTLTEAVARTVAPGLGLRVLEPPFDIGDFTLDMIWHQGRDDAALAWLRGIFLEEAEQVRELYTAS